MIWLFPFLNYFFSVLAKVVKLSKHVPVVTGSKHNWGHFNLWKSWRCLLNLYSAFDYYIIIIWNSSLFEDHFASLIPLINFQFCNWQQLLPHFGWVLHKETKSSTELCVTSECSKQLFSVKPFNDVLRYLITLNYSTVESIADFWFFFEVAVLNLHLSNFVRSFKYFVKSVWLLLNIFLLVGKLFKNGFLSFFIDEKVFYNTLLSLKSFLPVLDVVGGSVYKYIVVRKSYSSVNFIFDSFL